MGHRLQLRTLALIIFLVLIGEAVFAFQGIVRSTTRPTLWLPLKNDIGNIGSTSFTTSSNAVTFGSVASRSASYFAGVTGSGSGNRVNVTSNETSLSLGSGDFTIEFWVYPITLTSQPYIIDYRPLSDQSANFPAVRINSSGNLILQIVSGGASSQAYVTAAAVSTGAWNHVALVRSSGVFKYYINGVASGSYSGAQTFTVSAGSSRPQIGSSGWSYNNTLDGYLYDMKVWVGRAIYKTDFAPAP